METIAPKNDVGMLPAINHKKSFLFQETDREYCHHAINETNTFNIKAEGRITSGANAKIPIRARYPLAPPCPTLEYKRATTKRRKRKNMLTGSILMHHKITVISTISCQKYLMIIGFIINEPPLLLPLSFLHPLPLIQ